MAFARNLSAFLADRVAGSDFLWKIVSRTVVRWSQYLCQSRRAAESLRIVQNDQTLKKIFSQAKVIGGPFEGMSYGEAKSFCSSYFPKILGTYEAELIPTINTLLKGGYETVVDVGAAEGYYAVGFALKSPTSRVIAFEQSALAREQLRILSKANAVSGKIEVRGQCELHDLLRLPASRGLVILDCEGYEEKLLATDLIRQLRQWDFLIEAHDGFVRGVTKLLQDRFHETHDVAVIETVHDLDKADRFPMEILGHLSRRDQDLLLSEQREHATLRWMFCKARKTSNSG